MRWCTYNTAYIQCVGIAAISDCLSAIEYYVFDKKTISMKGLLDVLAKNFENYEEFRYELIYHTPKYGNDNDYADKYTQQVFELYYHAVNGRPTPRGTTTRVNILPTTCHVYFGQMIGALPDGRKAYEPLSEGISPVQGADTNGPTAVIKSAAKIDHLSTGGTLLNQ